jgi:bifunctional DNA-binding transcriptional regulator/antitoxin component of YhaV-PrlF toxin-antitoxin module
MALKVKVQKTGRNYFTSIPKDVREHLDLNKSDTLQYVIRDSGAVEIRKAADERTRE